MTGDKPGNGDDKKEKGDPYSADDGTSLRRSFTTKKNNNDNDNDTTSTRSRNTSGARGLPLAPASLSHRSLGRSGEIGSDEGHPTALHLIKTIGGKMDDNDMPEDGCDLGADVEAEAGAGAGAGAEEHGKELKDAVGELRGVVATNPTSNPGTGSGTLSQHFVPPPSVLSDAIAAAYRQGFQQGVSVMSSATTGLSSAVGGQSGSGGATVAASGQGPVQLAPFLGGMAAPGAALASQGVGSGIGTGMPLLSTSLPWKTPTVGLNPAPQSPEPEVKRYAMGPTYPTPYSSSDVSFSPQLAVSLPPPQLQHLLPLHRLHEPVAASSGEPLPSSARTNRNEALTSSSMLPEEVAAPSNTAATLQEPETRAIHACQGGGGDGGSTDGKGDDDDGDTSANASASDAVMAMRRERARLRAGNRKDYISMISTKSKEEMSTFEKNELRSWEARRSKKNTRSRERSLQVKARVKRILEIPIEERTADDASFLLEYTGRQQRKNEGDRLRRERIRVVSGGKSGPKPRGVKVTARGHIQLPDGRVCEREEEAAAALQPTADSGGGGTGKDKTGRTAASGSKRSKWLSDDHDPFSGAQQCQAKASKCDNKGALTPHAAQVPAPAASWLAVTTARTTTAPPPLPIPSGSLVFGAAATNTGSLMPTNSPKISGGIGGVVLGGTSGPAMRSSSSSLAHSRMMLTTTAMMMMQQQNHDQQQPQHHHRPYHSYHPFAQYRLGAASAIYGGGGRGQSGLDLLYGTGASAATTSPAAADSATAAMMAVPPTTTTTRHQHHHCHNPPMREPPPFYPPASS